MKPPPSNPEPRIPPSGAGGGGGGDSRLPLVLGFIVALVLHASVLTMLVSGFGTGVSKPADRLADVEDPLPPRDELTLGRDTPAVSTLSWISHEDYRQLVAPQERSEQPALQEVVDPVAEAPPIRDATPPMPTPQPDQPPTAAAQPTPASESATPGSGMPSDPAPDGELAMAEPTEQAQPDQPQSEAVQATETQSAPESSPPSPESRPTSAARDEQTVDPTSLTDSDLEQKSGNVLVGQGIEITTARPDITIITALFSAGIRNTRVEIKFNRDGKVDYARLLASTGIESVDAAVLASLYKWKAKGEKLQIADPHITLSIDYRFTR